MHDISINVNLIISINLQLTASQATQEDLFVDDLSMSQNAVDAEVMRQYLTPGAVDGFLGINMEIDETNDNNAQEGVQVDGVFPIPRELLVTMPIAEVRPDTKIIHINQPGQVQPAQANMDHNNTHNPTHIPTQAQRPTTPAPIPGTSGLTTTNNANNEEEVMDVQAQDTHPTQSTQVRRTQHDEDGASNNIQVQPKKGYNTKNRKTKQQNPVETQEVDPTVKERMTLLGEITELMKNTYGARRNEMHVWGTYIGLKAERVPAGRNRDKLLVKVENLMNEAIYGEETVEE